MPEPAITATGLAKAYGEIRALDGIDLEAQEGTVLGLLGPNGAGKTTAVRILATLLKPDRGSARIAGLDVGTQATQLRAHIGLAGQNAAVDENLTGYENLDMVGRLYHLGKGASQTRARELLERFELDDAGDRVAKTYSGGMRRRLDLAAALVARPPVLFLHRPPPRPARRPPTGAVPRRADHRPRPPQPPRPMGHDRGPRRVRHDRAADHAVPRGGRPARRPHRGDGPRTGDRGGHPRRAQGPRRRRTARGHAGRRGRG